MSSPASGTTVIRVRTSPMRSMVSKTSKETAAGPQWCPSSPRRKSSALDRRCIPPDSSNAERRTDKQAPDTQATSAPSCPPRQARRSVRCGAPSPHQGTGGSTGSTARRGVKPLHGLRLAAQKRPQTSERREVDHRDNIVHEVARQRAEKQQPWRVLDRHPVQIALAEAWNCLAHGSSLAVISYDGRHSTHRVWRYRGGGRE